MLADVRVMCLDGRRLPRERIKAMPAKRGDLTVARRRDPWRNEWVPMAVLHRPGSGDSVLPTLDQVRITRWSGANLILVGVEHIGRSKQAQAKPQAWWVRLLTDDLGLQQTSPPVTGG